MQSSGNNLVQLAGTLSVEPFTIGGNGDILHFSIFCKDFGGLIMDCTIFKESIGMRESEYVNLLTKGRPVFVKGYLKGSNYTSRSGRKIYKNILVVEKIRESERARTERSRPKEYIPDGFHLV